ncbi:ECF transporter S component [Clostridium rectalis]|uniref:ECF transporter S component n=1 Tax=Clostridium rectalis TaxID=2040295 RepID=UPI000F63E1B1|nr:ECF transporter S component [Clostridium rectalis]
MSNIKKIVFTSLLISLSIVIPMAFGFLAIQIGPFSATLAAHVPLFISMFLGPEASAIVGVGSCVGFLMTKGSYIAARAFMHTFVGAIGGYMLKNGIKYKKVVFITAPIHGVLEALAVIPFGISLDKILITVGIGSLLHHTIDGFIALYVIKILLKTVFLNLVNEK